MSLIRKHRAVLQAWACLALVYNLSHITQQLEYIRFRMCVSTAWLLGTWSISADLSPASTATNVFDLQTVVNCRFRGTGCQPVEAVVLDMAVHLLRMLFQTFLNAAHTLYY